MHLLHLRNSRNVSRFDLQFQNLTPIINIEIQLTLRCSDLRTNSHSRMRFID